MVSGFALLALTTAAIASLFVREDETPVERREAAFEARRSPSCKPCTNASTASNGRRAQTPSNLWADE